MFRIPRSPSWPPAIDLSTVRDTLLYMRDDMQRVPGLEKVAAAIDTTLEEIEAAERSGRQAAVPRKGRFEARFFPSRRW